MTMHIVWNHRVYVVTTKAEIDSFCRWAAKQAAA
jgi:hypothetical protein